MLREYFYFHAWRCIPYCMFAHILGTRSPLWLNFVSWGLMFVGSVCGAFLVLAFWHLECVRWRAHPPPPFFFLCAPALLKAFWGTETLDEHYCYALSYSSAGVPDTNLSPSETLDLNVWTVGFVMYDIAKYWSAHWNHNFRRYFVICFRTKVLWMIWTATTITFGACIALVDGHILILKM